MVFAKADWEDVRAAETAAGSAIVAVFDSRKTTDDGTLEARHYVAPKHELVYIIEAVSNGNAEDLDQLDRMAKSLEFLED